MNSYGYLLLFALAVNYRDLRMMVLAAVVGVGVLAPVGRLGLSYDMFYLTCFLGELAIALLAYWIAASASYTVIWLSVALSCFHAIGWHLDGYPPESPYHLLVKITEHAGLVACIVLSKPFVRLRNHAARSR